MRIDREILVEWEQLYTENPEACIQGIWAGFSSTATQKSMADFAVHIQTNYPEIFKKIYEAPLKEFLKGWKSIVSAKRLHRVIQDMEQDRLRRREFLAGGMSTIGLSFLGYTGPDLLTQRIAGIMAAQSINIMTIIGHPRNDLGSALWKDTLPEEQKIRMKKNSL